MSNRFTWLHLADLHLRESDSWDSNFVLQRLLEDARQLRADGVEPDAVFITGDLTFSGRTAEFSLVEDFVQRLTEAVGLSPDRCFYVPGNHDVDRNQVNFAAKAIREKLMNGRNDGMLAEVAEDPASSSILFAPLSNYAAFVPPHSAISEGKPYFVTRLDRGIGPDIIVVGLNSAWLAFDDGPAIVGRRQVQLALDGLDEDAFVIGLVHHSLSSLAEWDREFVSDIVDHHFDVLLRGHLHRTRLETLGPSPYRCSQIAAGGTYTGGRAQNGYNAVVVDFALGSATAHLRHYRPDGGGLWVEDNIFRDPKPGLFRWLLPKRFLPWRSKEKEPDTPEIDQPRKAWVRIEVVSSEQEIDVASVVSALKSLLSSEDILLINVQTGSLWIQIEMPARAYLQLLDLIAAEDDRLGTLGPGYKVTYVGPHRPSKQNKVSEAPGSRYKKVRIFVSSPGDVAKERECVVHVSEELNKSVADAQGIVLEVLRWETDAVPGVGRPQDIINRDLDRADVLIGILWSRFGTPTVSAGSGTEEEFNVAYDSWSRSGRPKILFYFKKEAMVVNSRDQLDQLNKVLQFRDKLAKELLYSEFVSLNDFESQIRKHLTQLVLAKTTGSRLHS